MTGHGEFETIIIGGGIAGLTAAAYAARAGQRVGIYERSSHLGGMAATETSNGFFFNMGPHALYKGGPADSVLSDLGVAYHGTKPRADLVTRNGRFYTMPVSASALMTTRLLGPAAKIEAARCLAGLAKLDPAPLDDVPLEAWLEGSLRRSGVRDFIRALTRVTSYANAPRLASAGALIRQLQFGSADGVVYVDEGWGTLVRGLQEAAVAAGARLVTRTRAEAVERRGRSLVVRFADGEERVADSVIIAAAPKVARDLVGAEAAPGLQRWVDTAVPMRAACLDVALRKLPRPRHYFALGIDRPTYLSVHSNAAKLAPEGASLVSLIKYLEPGDHDAAAAEAELEGVLDLAQPGWREQLIQRRALPSMIVSQWLPLAENGGLAGRPGPQVAGFDGLFVAGDWVGSEGMLADAAFASGRRAGQLAAARAASATMGRELVAS